MKPRIAVTLGDPAGVGPEVVSQVCSDPEVLAEVEPVVVGRRMLLSAGALAYGKHPPEVEVVEAGEGAEITPGRPSAAGGRQAAAFIEKAVRLCQGGQVHAMATAPISKEALKAYGSPHTGHTTMLAALTGAETPVMMLAGSRIKVVLATIHVALRDVPGLLTTEGIYKVGKIADEGMRLYLGMERPRLAVAALNPHAGEAGMFGDEEERIITPAVERLRAAGVEASGPHSADTLFWRHMKGEFDLVMAMYHDQGLIPLKLRHFEDAVNLTLGLPIIRTSVDHGTAYELAGKGKANPASMKAAVLLAGRMARRAAASGGNGAPA